MNKSMVLVGLDELQRAYYDCRTIAYEADNIRTMVTKCLNGDCTPSDLRASMDILKVKIGKTKRLHERMAKAYSIIN
jgi:hypothetical protein